MVGVEDSLQMSDTKQGDIALETQQDLDSSDEDTQAAEVEELVVGVEDSLQMSDTEQGDIALETQQDLDSSDKDTQAAEGTHKGKGKGKSSREGQHVLKEKADKGAKNPLFCSVLGRSRN